ncbi:MAG TPA: hypothetical protein VGF15_00605 [Solirubrobacteraceae bacterium]
MARVLIVAGGGRGLHLTERLIAEGHAVRVTTRSEQRRHVIQAAGAECWIGTPDRLATLRQALENVTVTCWLLANATGTEDQIADLHTSRLEFFLGQIIDSTVRGFIYEMPSSSLASDLGARGSEIAHRLTSRNSIPLRVIGADLCEQEWLEQAHAAVTSVLG